MEINEYSRVQPTKTAVCVWVRAVFTTKLNHTFGHNKNKYKNMITTK